MNQALRWRGALRFQQGDLRTIAALFYVDPVDPEAGGTGHTIRVCGIAGVPTGFQEDRAEWIFPS